MQVNNPSPEDGRYTSIAVTSYVTGVLAAAAKAQLIEAVYGIVTPANVKGFWIFDQSGAVSTITDRSTIGGTTAHTVTLRDGSLVAINASTMSLAVTGLAPHLSADATHVWDTPDAADLSFGNGAVDSAFSIVGLVKLTSVADYPTILAKGDTTGTNYEYHFLFNGGKLTFDCYSQGNSAIKVGRLYNTSLAADIGAFHTYMATKSSAVLSSGINLYRDGVAIDDTDDEAGVYVAMDNKTAAVGSYITAGGIYTGAMAFAVIIVVAEELSAVQAARLDAVLRGYTGIAL